LRLDQSLENGDRTFLPLSYGQRALWFLHRLAPESGAYHISALGRVSPALEVPALRRAVSTLAARHAVLRTTFHDAAGEPYQQVWDVLEPGFAEADAAAWSAEQVEAWLQQEAYRPFDLEAGPPLRFAVLRRGDDDLLLLAAHHLVCDFWTLALLTRELAALYGEAAGGPAAALSPAGLSYSAAVLEQRESMAGPEGERLWEHWRERLALPLPVLDLPTDRPRPPVQTDAGDCVSRRLDAELSRQAGALGRAHGATLFMALLATFELLLHRISGQEDLIVGTPTAGRRRAELAGTAGYFVNAVVLRTSLAGEPSFSELLSRVRQTTLAAFDHQDYPFALLAERLQIERDASRSPLFQVMFLLQKARRAEDRAITAFALGEGGARMGFGGLVLESMPWRERSSQFDLTLRMGEVDGALVASLLYNPDLFDPSTAERMLECFSVLLAGAVAAPQQRISEIPLLGAAERMQLLAEGSGPAAVRPAGLCLHQLFEAQAARTPEATAVVDGAERSTYAELEWRASRLACTLRRLGVRPEVRVGVLLERSTEMVAALLGVLKAGGAYVPLDPAYPAQRLGFLAEDAGIAVLLSRGPLRDRLALPGTATLLLDEEREADEGEQAADPGALPTADNLAYLIYTSGSTGRPKGVAIRHGSAVERMFWARDAFAVADLAGGLASTSICFDLSVFELFAPLSWGGTVILAADALALPELPAAGEVRLVNTVPSAMNELVRAGRVPASVRIVNLAGEPLRRDLVERLYALPGIAEVWNLYGPSEDTTYSTGVRLERGSAREPSIGRLLPNGRGHVLDARQQPVPPGVPGELWLGGAGLARGYLGRPDLTADRFRPDPFAGAPGERLYRTGDLVRRRAGGELELIGRLDHQVKVRGFRIELGEIETALLRHPGIADAIVLVREDVPGDRRLAAYVVAVETPPQPAPPPAELRSWLAQSLPDVMIPAAWVVLPELPRTPNGKVDRRALPPPEAREAAGTDAGHGAPLTPIEEVLAGIWADVLGTAPVSATDDFFDLGGHSLLATQVVSRIRTVLGLELPLRTLFKEPTLARLAAAVEAARDAVSGGSGGNGAQAPPLVAVPRGAHPLSFAQERLWFLDRLDPGTPTYDIPAAVSLRGELAVASLASALTEVVRRHEALRTTFEVRAGVPCQIVAPPAPAALPVVDLSALPEAALRGEADRRAADHARISFDLERGPLFAAALLRLAPDLHRLLFTVHHISADGWSIGVLVRELGELYTASREGRPAALPALPVQVADYAVWQRRWLAGGAAAEVGYWLERLGGEAAPLDLPADRPRPAVQTYRGGRRERRLPPELTGRLRALGRREGATLFMVLLAGTQALLARQAGQQDVLLGTPVAGRRRSEVEGLIGCFLNTLVLRTDLSGDPGFRTLIERVREVTLGAFTHQDVPFELLLTRLGVERDPSRAPLFQVFFNHLNLPARELRLSGLTAEVLPAPDLAAKFDMTFYVHEDAAGVRFELVYNADLFDGARMEETLAELELLLAQAEARPEEPLPRLSLVTPQAAALLPDPTASLDGGWNGAVHELFAAQARRAPERTALEDREGVWTYGELDEATGRLAAWLAAHGVERGERVAIYAHRSAPLVQAVLGVLKAGAAFVILDPAYPAPRLLDMLELAAPAAWLQVAAAGAPPAAVDAWLSAAGGSGCPRLELAGGGPAAALAQLPPGEGPERTVGPDDIALVAFTSGSTGKPKGIEGRHGPLSHFLPWQCAHFGMRADDRFSLLSGLAHDPLQRDIFTPLFLGAAIVVPDPTEIGAAGRLARWMARERVTVAHLTPAMGQLLTERPASHQETEAPAAPELRLVLLVGDALTRLDVARLRRLAPGAAIVNLYGSTETQRAVAFHLAATVESGEGEERSKQVLPLGRGMQDVQLLVLNGAGLLAGIGEVGEIAVRSPHLARGYRGDEELTAEKFQVNPFTGAPGDRIYRTGDLGRYLPDGEVVFAGRADQQVKIRGFRIEPAEIQAVLGAVPGVREAIVLARQDRGERRLAAYVVPEREGAVAVPVLRSALRERLPAYMVPADFILLPRLPITPNGKVDRRALAAIAPAESARAAHAAIAAIAPPTDDRERAVLAAWREVLGTEDVGLDDNFFDLGGHSLLLVRLHARLQEIAGRELPLVDLFRYSTVRAQAEHLAGTAPEARRPAPPRRRTDGGGAIAIIGMAGRFPGARDVEEFWENLKGGRASISRFSSAELAAAGVPVDLAAHPRFVPARGVLGDADRFDAAFFDYSTREAELMDPQLRVFLECSWQALEDAGYDPARAGAGIGVYGGVTVSTYFLGNLWTNPRLLEAVGFYQAAIATDRDYLTTQVSYKLGLSGPSIAVQTACSTSLVALHLACQALRAGECEMALAGGVSIKFPQTAGYLHQEGGIDSADGCCRAFDAKASGTVWGSGAGIVVLKRLEDALADGDAIRAVVRGSAVNNDGRHKIGYTAPSLEAQTAVIAAAQDAAGVEPDSITFLEAHGTGTQLGDPIEVAAASRAFRRGTDRAGFCAIGSVKTNIGHLGAAAGVAGVLKTVLALEHGEIPPSLHFEAPNPAIDFAASPFRVAAALAPWPAEGGPRRAGVSSFGMGGTNAHVVLEEAPAAAPPGPSRPWQLLVLSARSEAALDAATGNLRDWLETAPPERLADAAWTLQVGRRVFAHRRALVCGSAGEARQTLAERDPRRLWTAEREAGPRPVVFLFPGQGAQHVDMGRGLYDTEPVFRRELDACADLLAPHLGEDLRQVLYPAAERRDEAARALDRTRLAQPALFAVEYALARLWMSWGVVPWAMLGHSLGEVVAACLAGVFPLADALAMVAARGAHMQARPPGAMLGVELAERELVPLLAPPLELAAVNGPAACVVSGPEEAVEGLAAALRERGVDCRRLRTSHAFHSAMMEPAAAALAGTLAGMRLAPPAIPYVSNLTADWIEAGQAADPAYWAAQMRRTVRFDAGVERLLAAGADPVFLEVGPGRTLGSLARRRQTRAATVASMRHREDSEPDGRALAAALGKLWMAGAEIDWAGVHAGETRRRVALPTYPFQRERLWIEPGIDSRGAFAAVEADRPAGWLHTYRWRAAALPRVAAGGAAGAPWLLLSDSLGVGERLAARLAAAGGTVVHAAGGLPQGRIVDLRGLEEGADGLFELAAALDGEREPREIIAVTARLHDMSGEEPSAERWATLAACRAIPRRHPGLACRSVDVPVPRSEEAKDRLADRLLRELCLGGGDPVVAWHPLGQRFVRTLEPLTATAGAVPSAPGGAGAVLGEDAGGAVAGLLTGMGLVPDSGGELCLAVAVVPSDLAGAARAVAAFETLARERRPALCALLVDPAADAAAYAEEAALCRSRDGEAPWIAVGLPLSALPRPLAAEALRLALAQRETPQLIVVPPPAAPERGARPETLEAERTAERTGLSSGARGATEARITELFERLLGVSGIGVHDDFFELGGHSLLGTRLLSLLAAELGAELSIRALFEAPTPAALAERIEEERAASGRDPAPAAPIERVPRDGEIPASFAQQRLWFLDQLAPGSAAYNLPMAISLRGALAAGVLAAALAEVVRRHEALRTTFRLSAEGPVQVIAPLQETPLPLVDLGALPPETGRAEARRLAHAEGRRPFDLQRGPLLRAGLIRLEPGEHLLLLTQSHVVSDGWSLGLLIRELGLLYAAFRDGRPSPLPELPIQYADYSAWQRRRLSGEALAAELAFWRGRLDGIPPLELPTDRARPLAASGRGAACPLDLQGLGPGLERLCREERVTVFMAAFAALAALLHRYSGQSDLSVGTPVAGRTHAWTEELIGFFVNTVVLRAGFGGEPTAAALLAQVRETTLDAFAHQELPFEKLVGELQPDRDLSRTPLFQVMLALQNTPVELPRVAGLELAMVPAEVRTAKLDLTFALREAGGELLGYLEYSTDLWDAPTIQRLAGHYRAVLGALAAGGRESAVAELPLLAPAERQQLLEWNDTAIGDLRGLRGLRGLRERRDLCLHHLIEEQARRTPGAPALVVDGGETLTYAALNAAANRLARYLRGLGVGPETVAAICVERSAAMITGLLAVLKAGGAYLPLDPDYPADRLAFMLADSGARVLLAQSALLPLLGEAAGAALRLDDPAAPWLDLPDGDLPGGAAADDLAYVIFTSGSTGRPKGTMNSHRGIVNRLLWGQADDPLGAGDRVLQKTPFSFDVSVWEMFWPLTAGACLVMSRPGGHRDAVYILQALVAHGITVVHFVAPMLRAFLDGSGLETAAGRGAAEGLRLRRVMTSGEAVSHDLQQQHDAVLGVPLHNLYGPTEAAVEVTHWACDPESPRRLVPIGRPVANTRIHLLDRHGREVPIGVPGELAIGGVQVARGYLGRPALTAEKFVPDPFGEAGARLYRTGDLARHLPDGAVDYLGRIDNQVKIRGVRVELGEIESVLGRHPGVREAAALVREDRPGERRLVAYVVAAGSPEPGVEELRAHLRERLPEPMVPAAVVFLAALPLSASGKLDRRALPAPERGGEGGHLFVAPRTAAEERLAGIVGELLRQPQVGVHDNFFALGGDSILAIQLVSRAARAGLRLTPRQIFEAPTVAGLARAAAQEEATPAAGPAAGALPLTPIQRWFFAQNLAHPEQFNQALVLELAELATPVPEGIVLEWAWRRIAAHHDALRLRFAPDEQAAGGWRQWYAEPAGGEPRGFAWIDLSALPAERFAGALESAAAGLQGSLDLGRGPLARLALLTPAAGRPRLLAVIHHLAVDGVSWRILLEDLETACRQLAVGAEPVLPPRTASFAAWAERLRELAGAGETLAEADGWCERLGLPPAPLPSDAGLDADDDRVGRAASVTVELGAEPTRALLQEVPRALRAQVNEALLAALARAFAEWTGEPRLLLDLEGHGREEVGDLDVSRTAGWFTTLFPVLLDLGGAADAPAALRAVKEELRAVPRRGLGFGLLRELAEGEAAEGLRALPRPEVVFNYLGQLDASVAAGRLFRPAPEPPGPTRHPGQRRAHALEINAAVSGGRLRTTWTYGRGRHRAATIEALAGRFLAALAELVELCAAASPAALTASDFPLAGLAQRELERLLASAAELGGEVEDLYPMSPLQQGMLFHVLEDPESGVYVEQVRLSLEIGGHGGGELEAFERAWEALVARHAVLRTGFWLDSAVPLSIVYRRLPLPWQREDWRGIDGEEQQRRLAAWLDDDRRRGFELTRPPLLRLAWIRLDERRVELVWTFHHILSDGWSLPIVLRDLLALYQASERGEPASLATPPAYREHVAWLAAQDAAAAERFWRGRLAGFAAPTLFGLDRQRAAAAGESAEPRQAEIRTRLPAARSEALRSFTRRCEITLNTLFQGAWARLLSIYSGSGDVVFGAVTAGRSAPLPGIEEMVGLLINTLPARLRLSPERAPVAWLQEVQGQQAELRQYEHSALHQVRGWSEVPAGQPLFESILVFENYPLDAAVRDVAAGLGVRAVEVREQTSYPLTLVVEPGPRLNLRLSYDPRRFERPAMVRLLGHLESVLAALSAPMEDTVPTLGDLPLLSAAERHQVAVEWSAAPVPAPAGPPEHLHELFAAWAVRTPEAPAVTWQGRSLTYRELDRRANRVAHQLRRLGVTAGALVGLAVERGVELVVGLLGVLKAGGAYLPLDPAYPAERLAYMLADSAAGVLLTATAQVPAVGALAGAGVHLLWIDEDDAEGDVPEAEAAAPPPPDAPRSAADLAYVIYTSGSTGQPKGVMVSHGNVVRLLRATEGRFAFSAADVWTLFHSYAFDFSVWELWGALAYGGRLVVVPRETTRDPVAFYRLLAGERVTVLNQTPSAFRQLTQVAEVARREGEAELALRLVIFGGEALEVSVLASWLAPGAGGAPPPAFVNMYGITETTVHVTWRWMREGDLLHPGVSPIGVALPHLRVCLLGRSGEEVPIGVPGEIHVGGEGVARGYLRRPELTAQRFVPDPRAAAPGSRLYRSGDLARYRPDGELEYLGRIDHQVKIRGFRLELGEIEAVLGRHPEVRDAAVLLREDWPGEHRLTAYAVPAGSRWPAVEELRAHLREHLPEYMVPAAVVVLEALPLTTNGKLDRRALPAPQRPPETAYADPEGETERTVAEIWKEVLRTERVGRNDNFFDLGGHSLLMIQVQRKIEQSFGRKVLMLDLFRVPTVSSMATFLRSADSAAPAPELDRQSDEERHEGRDRLRQRLKRRQELE